MTRTSHYYYTCTILHQFLQDLAKNVQEMQVLILAATLAKSCSISCKICARLCKNRARKGTSRARAKQVLHARFLQDSCMILQVRFCWGSSSCNSFCSLSVLLSPCSSNCSCSYSIVQCLVLEDRILVSKQGVRQYLKRFAVYQTVARKPGSGLPPKLSPAILRLIEDTMRKDNETTATQLQSILATRQIYVSLTVHNSPKEIRAWMDLSWISMHIVSLFVMQINSNVFSEHKLTPMTNLITLYGAMKLQFSLRITDILLQERWREASTKTSPEASH